MLTKHTSRELATFLSKVEVSGGMRLWMVLCVMTLSFLMQVQNSCTFAILT